jgi:Predicted integral membrane protein
MRRPNPELLAMLAVTAALVVASGLLRQGCAVDGGWCPTDLRVMWFDRGLSLGHPPYQTPVPGSVGLEYPVLTGGLMWLLALPVHSLTGYIWLSTVVLGLCSLGITATLYPIAGRRTWLWAAAPALIWYVSYNYDAFAALFAVGALALLAGRYPDTVSRNRLFAAAALLGFGGAAKLYPLLFLLPLLLWLLFGDPVARLKLAAQTLGVAVGAFALVNLPVLAANPAGWLAPYQFQASRPIGVDTLSIWVVLAELPSNWTNLISTAVTAIALIAVAVWSWQRGRRFGDYPLLPAAVAMLAAYLLANKVYSPQYALWLLPLVVLAGAKASTVIAYLVLDAALFWTLQLAQYGDGLAMVVGVTALVVFAVVRFSLTLLFAREAMAAD